MIGAANFAERDGFVIRDKGTFHVQVRVNEELVSLVHTQNRPSEDGRLVGFVGLFLKVAPFVDAVDDLFQTGSFDQAQVVMLRAGSVRIALVVLPVIMVCVETANEGVSPSRDGLLEDV